MSDERPDKCPTCGIAREHDGPHYRKALKQAGKPMCPDPFHDPAPKPQGLDAVSGDGTWDEADERYAAAMNAPSPDGEPHIPLEVANRRLREVERERDTLREAVVRIAAGDYGEDDEGSVGCPDCRWDSGPYTIHCERHTRPEADEIARRALASLDEQESA